MTIQIDFKKFFQKQWKNLVYVAVGLCSFVLALCLMIWAGTGSSTDVVTITAEVKCADTTRYEYIVGQKVDTSTITMILPDGTELTDEMYTTTIDTATAGRKAVQLTYQVENTVYEAYYGVEIFAVRHLDLRNKTVEKDRYGEWDFSELEIWAELSGPSHEFLKPAAFSEIDDTAIILDETLFTPTVVATEHENFYQATITCGNKSISFSFSSDPNALVQDADRILFFTNETGGTEKLTLYVQNSSSNFAPPNGSANIDVSGTYVYQDAQGNKTQYTFTFNINGWTSTFKSS